MSKNKTVLISVNVLVEVPEDVINDGEFNDFDKLENALSEAVEAVETPFQLSWESTKSLVLDTSTMNCGKCESCGSWVSDRETADPIQQLNIAATFNGKLLCDECLPHDHKLAF